MPASVCAVARSAAVQFAVRQLMIAAVPVVQKQV